MKFDLVTFRKSKELLQFVVSKISDNIFRFFFYTIQNFIVNFSCVSFKFFFFKMFNRNVYISEHGKLSSDVLLNVAEILALRLPEGEGEVKLNFCLNRFKVRLNLH